MFHVLAGKKANLPFSSSFKYSQYAASVLSLFFFFPLLFLNLVLADSLVVLLSGLYLLLR